MKVRCIKKCYALLRLWKEGEEQVILDSQFHKLQKCGGEHFVNEKGDPVAKKVTKREKLAARRQKELGDTGDSFFKAMNPQDRKVLVDSVSGRVLQEIRDGSLANEIVSQVLIALEEGVEAGKLEDKIAEEEEGPTETGEEEDEEEEEEEEDELVTKKSKNGRKKKKGKK